VKQQGKKQRHKRGQIKHGLKNVSTDGGRGSLQSPGHIGAATGQLVRRHAVHKGIVQVDLVLGHVQALVNLFGNGLDFRAEFCFDFVQIVAVVVRDEIDGHAEVAKAAGATDPVQVGLGHAGKVEVDHNVDGLHVDAAREEISADKIPNGASAEIVENTVSNFLRHARMNAVAGISQFRDLLREQNSTLG